MAPPKCIYCGRYFNPNRGEGDHIQSGALFGEFEGDVRFRGACQKCNNSFSPYEQILAQATPLGFMRGIVNPTRRRRKSGIRQRGAKGSKAPQFIAWASDHGELVEPLSDPQNVQPVDRLTIQDEDGSEHYVRLYAGMPADKLRADFAQCGSKNPKLIFCSFDLSNEAIFKKLLEEVSPEYRWMDRPDTEVGVKRVRGRTIFQFSTDAYRAIAKIAFHYYLVHNRRGYRGDEPQFSEVRQYIKKGGEHEQFFDRAGPSVAMPFGETSPGCVTLPASWCHVLAAHEVDKNVVVNMRLFAGPDSLGEAHSVTLGEIRSKIVCPTGYWGHVYTYDNCGGDKYAGFVDKATLRRLD
jgi:hypothetical protein